MSATPLQNILTTANQGRAYSSFWADCPEENIRRGRTNGTFFEDDFVDFGLPGTQTTEINLGRYKVFSVTAGKWQTDAMPHSTTPLGTGGIISGLGDSDGDSGAIGTQACPFSLATTVKSKLWFEARIAVTSILTNMTHFFVGLGENAVATFAAAVPLDNANATSATLAMIGFNRLEDGLGVLNTSYADQAALWTDIQAAANSTLAANTWIKLGMTFDFTDQADILRAGRFYVDGVECTSYLTKAALAALTHVDAKGLGFLMAYYADSAGTACYHYIDRVKIFQQLPE